MTRTKETMIEDERLAGDFENEDREPVAASRKEYAKPINRGEFGSPIRFES